MTESMNLLIGCLKQEPVMVKVERLRCYCEPDWTVILKNGAKQNLLPLLYYTIKDIISDISLPEKILGELRNAYYSAAARNMNIYNQLHETLDILEEAGVNVIVLKGAHLAEEVYGNIALRPMSDIDLLAMEEDLPAIDLALKQSGYKCTDDRTLSNTMHLSPYYKEGGVPLEIHLQIIGPPYAGRMNIDDLWQRSRKEVFQGSEVSVLSPEDLYLHLCLHSAIQHGLDMGLISCIDIAKLIKHYEDEMKWETAWERGVPLGAQRALCLMPALTERLFDIPLPTALTLKIKDQRGLFEALNLAEQLITERGSSTSKSMARMFGEENWRGKAITLSKRLFPPRETVVNSDANRNKQSLLSLVAFYSKRAKVLFKRNYKTAWCALWRDQKTMEAMNMQNKRNSLRNWLNGTS